MQESIAMQQISEEEAHRLAGDADCPVLFKEENDITESAVCLKKFPGGYVLGISCDRDNVFELFFSDNYDEIARYYEDYVNTMHQNGSPFAK
jgi:hypothetical protein